MTDSNVQPQAAGGNLESTRTLAIIIYALFLATFVGLAVGPLIGVILAYVKRDDARGSIYESHFSNAIEVFWVSLVACIVGIATIWFGVGVLVFIGLVIWYLFRVIKGLVRLIDGRAYS